MLSVVVYGRNDNYGYNLSKRAALSLNNFAELLTDENDEIIFVDFNTPDLLPTFPEAIRDTLTSKCRDKLRVLRVRPRDVEHLLPNRAVKTLEPLARNVGFRHTNPENRWVLSTNTDMIFVPQKKESLSEIVANLPDGHYGLPRFEIPESVWEGFDRTKPKQTIRFLNDVSWQIHMNHVVEVGGSHRYDAPGDFQLFLRDDIFEIYGADESMARGWHVDSNLARRLSLVRGNLTTLSEVLRGFHCDHTKVVTPLHRPKSPANSLWRYVSQVKTAPADGQEKTWGLTGRTIEEISLVAEPKSTAGIFKSLKIPPQREITESKYSGEGYNVHSLPPNHVLSFITEILLSQSTDCRICWVGRDNELSALVRSATELLGLSFATAWLPKSKKFAELRSAQITIAELAKRSDILIWDFSDEKLPVDNGQNEVSKTFQFVLGRLRRASVDTSSAGPLIVGVDVVGNDFAEMFHHFIGAAKTPYNAGIRHGYIYKSKLKKLQPMPRNKLRALGRKIGI